MMNENKYRVLSAYHEAVHAVVGHLIGRYIQEISIVSGKGQSRGYSGYCKFNATVDFLDQATEALHEEDPEFQEAVSQSLIKVDQLIDHCAQIVQDLLELCLKYRAAHLTSGLSPNIDALTETLARIELRRRIENRIQE